MKKLFTLIISLILVVLPVKMPLATADNGAREVEYLGRGGYGVVLEGKNYLSWRLLGTEPISQKFYVYRDGNRIASNLDRLYYEDTSGSSDSVYQVVKSGEVPYGNDKFMPYDKNYFDIIVDKPGDGYLMYDASVGDVDNDGEYEFIVKWDPADRKDNGSNGKTSNVYIDCYKMNGTKLWRIDLGQNIRAGAHYTQFIVYDFDGDGKAEMALRTAPGSKDSTGAYVSKAGAPIGGETLLWTDSYTGEVCKDTDYLANSKGHIIKGPDWLTMFEGETGKAIQTVNFYPQRGDVNTWGDNYGNRSERYLGGVAYLDGVHPSLVMSRGYYKRAAMAAYDWDGQKFTIRWTRDDKEKNYTLYGNGDHSLSVCDADNDGKDEVVFGSTVVDDDGSILNSTDHGHGDALHASDFNNDGEQEIFSVHEEAEYYKEFGAETRKAKDASIISKIPATDDVGRGLMGNIYDDDNADSEIFSSADSNFYNMSGTKLSTAPAGINPSFLVWWDGSLDREILYRTSILKYDYKTASKKNLAEFSNVLSIEKDGPLLSADLFGDWREEVCYQTEDAGTIRIFMTTAWSKYKIPTLMHDTQYRTAIAWQNVGYNQPPHPKFYVGKAAVSADNEYYLSPKTGFDTVKMVGDAPEFSEPQITPAPEGSFSVNIKATGDISRTIKSYSDISYGDALSYAFPKYYVENGIAYMATANSTGTHYGGSIAHVTKDTDISIKYTKKYTGVVSYDDLDKDINKSANLRASNCMAQDNKKYVSDYILKPGRVYTIVIGYQNSWRGSQFVADDTVLHTVTETDTVVKKSNWGERTIDNVTVNNPSALYTVSGSAGTYDPIDTVLIIDKGDNINIGNAVFGNGTVTVPVSVITGNSEVNLYAAVYDRLGKLKYLSLVSDNVSGNKTCSLDFVADTTDTVCVMAWDKDMKPYRDKMTR